MEELRNFYPDFLKTDTTASGEAIVTQCNNIDAQTVVDACSYTIVDQTFEIALDKDGNVVYVPQLVRFGVEQTFQERLCTGNTCVSSLQCKCEDQLSPTNRAVIAYINQNMDDQFYVEEILLRECTAIV